MDLRVQTWRRDGRQMRRVRGRDRDAVLDVQYVLHAIQAFWRKLVVAKRPKQLGHNNVHLAMAGCFVGGDAVLRQTFVSGWPDCWDSRWAHPRSHVALDHTHTATPLEVIVSLEQNMGVGILLDGPEIDLHADGDAGS